MIVGCCFPGDDNDTLMWIQHALYGSMLWWLLGACKERYLAAVRLTGVRTELADRIRDRTTFDHRVLQDAHDLIAAHFRYVFDPAGQMPLPYDELSYKEHLERHWSRYFFEEMRRLTEYDPFVLAVLIAVANQNTETGYGAEAALVEWLKSHYGPMEARREGHWSSVIGGRVEEVRGGEIV